MPAALLPTSRKPQDVGHPHSFFRTITACVNYAHYPETWATLYNRVGVVKRHVDRRRVFDFPFVEGFGVAVAFAHFTKGRFQNPAGCPTHSRTLRMSGFRHNQNVSRSQSRSILCVYSDRVTKGLVRYYGTEDLHFITCSCYRRQPKLSTAKRRDLFLKILEEARRKYRFVVHGYVLMPEHFHLLITEPEVGDPSVVMKVVKQRFARCLNQRRRRTSSAQTAFWDSTPDPVWQKRFYDGANGSGSRSYATCTATR